MAQQRQSNLLIAVDAFEFTQSLLGGANLVVGGIAFSDGIYRPDDQARALWRVEAAPIGALTTFELERDEISGQWIIRSV